MGIVMWSSSKQPLPVAGRGDPSDHVEGAPSPSKSGVSLHAPSRLYLPGKPSRLVDFVSEEAEIAGKFAALDAQEKLDGDLRTVDRLLKFVQSKPVE